jgi:magnesium chelatase family protein
MPSSLWARSAHKTKGFEYPVNCREKIGEQAPPSIDMALYRTRSAAVLGIDAYLVDVEVDMYPGSARDIITVGMPDTAVRESRERIKSALSNSGIGYPSKSVTINLAPANVKKEGAGFDLPMAMGILGVMGLVKNTDQYLFVGELSLDGSLRPIRGALSIAACARKHGISHLLVPADNAAEAAVAEGVSVYGIHHMMDAVRLVNEPDRFAPVVPGDAARPTPHEQQPDFSDVRGQTTAKRALEVAAAGGHNVIMIGPPGSGKTMLARRLAGILPPLTFAEALETTQIHSVAGLLGKGTGLLTVRPFRAPHHTVSDAGLIGGGSGTPRPGEVSLAHNGVLFLDELPEFPRNVLELLRQPLEERAITLARSNMTLSLPANFMLIAASNPCRCGFRGDASHECRCTAAEVQRYLGRISGPLLDRIDLHIEVPAVPYKELRGKDGGVTSAEMRARVLAAREIQQQRGFYNAQIPAPLLRKLCALDEAGERMLEMAVRRMGLSARAHDRILKVARTIADLDRAEAVSAKHLAEAVQYRSLDRDYWS